MLIIYILSVAAFCSPRVTLSSCNRDCGRSPPSLPHLLSGSWQKKSEDPCPVDSFNQYLLSTSCALRALLSAWKVEDEKTHGSYPQGDYDLS